MCCKNVCTTNDSWIYNAVMRYLYAPTGNSCLIATFELVRRLLSCSIIKCSDFTRGRSVNSHPMMRTSTLISSSNHMRGQPLQTFLSLSCRALGRRCILQGALGSRTRARAQNFPLGHCPHFLDGLHWNDKDIAWRASR